MKIRCDHCGRKYEGGFVGIKGSNLCQRCFRKEGKEAEK